MDFELDLDSSFDWGFKAVSSDEVEQGKQQSEAINKVVEGSDNLNQKLGDLDSKLDQVLAIALQKFEDRLQEKELILESSSKSKFDQLEKLILPLLHNLATSSDEPYIYWPNRKEVIEGQMEKIVAVTRG